MSFSLSSVNKVFNSETESFQQTFNLTHRGDSIFTKRFDGSNSDVVNVAADSIKTVSYTHLTLPTIE